MARSNIKFNAAVTATTSGTQATAIALRARYPDETMVVVVHSEINSTDTAPVATPSTFSKLHFTEIVNEVWASPNRGGDSNRLQVFLARVVNPGWQDVVIDFDKDVDNGTMNALLVQGADPDDPLDGAPVVVTSEAAAVPTVTGFSTTDTEGIVFACYGSIMNTDPGAMTDFTERADRLGSAGSSWSRVITMTKNFADAAESSETYAFTNSVDTWGVAVFALKPATIPGPRVMYCNGFDQYSAFAELVNEGNSANISPQLIDNAFGSSLELVTGRDGAGLAVRLPTNDNAIDQLFFNNDNMPDDCVDGDRWAVGMSLNLGSNTLGSSPSGPQSFFCWGTGATGASRIVEIAWNLTEDRWEIWDNGFTNLLASGPEVANSPWQSWVNVEVEIYRHATNGFIRVWQEGGVTGSTNEGWKIPPYYRGLLPVEMPDPEFVPGDYHSALVCEFTGDTSTATLGTISGFAINGHRASSTNRSGHDVDDVYFSAGAPVGMPFRVFALSPTADYSVEASWAPSTGVDHYAVQDDTPGVLTDYVEATGSVDTNPRDLYSFEGLGFTPRQVHAVQPTALMELTSGIADGRMAGEMQPYGSVHWQAHEYAATSSQGIGCAGYCYPRNPETAAPWQGDEHTELKAGPEMHSSFSGTDTARSYGAWMLVLANPLEGTVGGEDGIGQSADVAALHAIKEGHVNPFWSSLHSIEQGITKP